MPMMPANSDVQAGLRAIRMLSEAFFGFESFNRRFLRQFGLTSAQFDIIATLGNTSGMNFRELGEKTLITKGTLTGVVDRLSAMGLARRVAGQSDRRTMRVELTPQGEAMFELAYPAITTEVDQMMKAHGFTKRDFTAISRDLARLRDVFQEGQSPARAA